MIPLFAAILAGISFFFHSITASASISTSISGEINLLTSTMLVAGRIAPKNSPCARPIFSHSPMLVTKIRVRTTSFKRGARLHQRRFDIPNRLHCLCVWIAHSYDLAVRSRRGRSRNRYRHFRSAPLSSSPRSAPKLFRSKYSPVPNAPPSPHLPVSPRGCMLN